MTNDLTIEEISSEYLNNDIKELVLNNYKEEFSFENSDNEVNLEKNINNKINEEILNYSKYNFDIVKEGCESCNIDSFTIIKDNFELFKQFINTDSIYVINLFNFLINLKNID